MDILDHDASTVLLRDGEVIAATEEERFTRRKHDYNFPIHAIIEFFTAEIKESNSLRPQRSLR